MESQIKTIKVIGTPPNLFSKPFLKDKSSKIKVFAQKNFEDYCEDTTIHGLKYVGNSKLFLLERIFFALSFIIVVLGAAYFVSKIYEKWNLTPVIVAINSNPTSITQDPFPAVTICNSNQAYKQKAEQFSIRNVKCTAATCPMPNGTVAVNWSPERGYPAVLPESYSPMHAAGTGESLGLSLMLDVERDSYYCSSTNSVGFKMLLHNPLEVPNMREIGLLVSPGHETKVRVRATKTESTQQLRSLNKESRACIFEGEYVLHNYKTYTQSNCMEECLAKILLRYCGCITHYMVDVYTNVSICSIYEASCVERVRLQSMVSRNGKGCANICWPACYDLSYSPDFFITPLSESGFHTHLEKSKDKFYMVQNMAVVNIYFKENWYRSSKQAEYVGITEFLSNIGGIIGLFFGFSFISLAEIIFYFLLKPVRMLILLLWSKRTKSAKVRKLQNLKLFEKQPMNN